ncbi:MAG: ATP synthase gamma chain [Candidatus Woesebacteria bacterium GW2011_GWA2_44_33]|uniref:ATP synthase gamma chain n=1 Tax=Candidatus Woesebacteria bacterium GW2011_GWA2_44_33 TaxID=1618564 RepID=A0A0G1J5K8_9BACT|nr:MAG: ATP synthase gamma chain [Candidatus Woesebacteria bacterium GW2011_GWA2_44_33]
MDGGKQLARRIRSARNISQITGAMEAVAASKMKKAQAIAAGGQPYQEMLGMVAGQLRRQAGGDFGHPLLIQTESQAAKPKLHILISSDKGLCGGLNSNLFRLAERAIPASGPVIAVGRKAVDYCHKTNWEMVGANPEIGDKPDYSQTKPSSAIAMEEFLARRVSSVVLIYQKFHNTLTQRPTADTLLPVQLKTVEEEMKMFNLNYIFKPGRQELLADLLPYYVHMSLYQAVVSAKAAEQSARMIAMKTASDNAEDVRGNLQLLYNQKRQEMITAEISDVVTAGMALYEK